MSVPPALAPVDALSVRISVTLADVDAQWRRALLGCTSPTNVAEVHERCVEEWRAPLYARLDELFAEMSELLPTLSPEERAAAAAMHRRLVQPSFLLSPFCRRAVDKPLGYPGDYGLVEMIFAGTEEGQTPLGTLLGNYALQSGPSAAHRGRLDWACGWIDREEGAGRILSFACGPEVILREWVRRGGRAEVTLADHDPAALAWAKKRLLRARARDNATTVRTVEANAFAFLRGTDPVAVLGEGYDVVTVLGLLDYLDDTQSTELLRALARVLRPDGLLLASNLHVTNPWRALMELTSDWNVAHRTVEGFEGLVRATGTLTPIGTELHRSGTNLYCAARRR